MAVTYKFEYHQTNNFLNLIVMLRQRESVGLVRSQKGLQRSLKGLKRLTFAVGLNYLLNFLMFFSENFDVDHIDH